jgi:hypothetical protein
MNLNGGGRDILTQMLSNQIFPKKGLRVKISQNQKYTEKSKILTAQSEFAGRVELKTSKHFSFIFPTPVDFLI